jgi:hypothetical protein
VQRRAQSHRAHPALLVGLDGHDAVGSQPDQPYGAVDGAVPLGPGQYADPRCPGQAGPLDVPAAPAEQLAPGCREGGSVRHLGAGDEADRAVRWQAEEVGEPAGGDGLDSRSRGRGARDEGVLVPGRGQPVRRQGSRQRTAEDPAEEPAAACRQQSGIGAVGELGDHLAGVLALFRQRSAKRLPQFRHPGLGADRPVGQTGQVATRAVERHAEW